MIYYSKNFSLEGDIQSEARAYRQGSQIHNKITRYDLVAKDTVDVHIKRLRDKLMDRNIIETVHGFGYSIKKDTKD